MKIDAMPSPVPTVNVYEDNLAVGTAGEYIVCADLILAGFNAFRADQVSPYDIAADVGGRLVRVQVKSTREPRPYPQRKQKHVVGYTWQAANGKTRHKLDLTAFDVLALVALDVRRVGYIASAEVRQCIQIPTAGNRRPASRDFAALTFRSALRF
jgi:hypothetical protein